MHLPPLRIDGELVLDAAGRQMLLRGVNLGGDSKVPWPHGGTQHPSDFADHRTVSFVNRPFPLHEADKHFARLRHWGFNVLRLLLTWEAVEHEGPGCYDEAFLDFFAAICERAGAHGLYVFIDFHQDVWARMSGGDGAPGWTFESVGLDFTRFAAAGAAHVMQQRFDYTLTSDRQPAYPSMSWVQNYRMPANGILWTLFWAGRWLTPHFMVDGVNIQEHLQGHLLGAMDQVARRIAHLPHVLGFDSLNEPGTGWLGQTMSPDGQASPLPGPIWSPLQALAVASGLPTRLPVRPGFGQRPQGELLVNEGGASIWREGRSCPLRDAGLYTVHGGQPIALRENAFREYEGRPLDISRDAFGPFFKRVAATIRAHRDDWWLFAEIDPFGALTGRLFPQPMPAHCVNASHWYDVAMLLDKHFDPTNSADLFSGTVAKSAADVQARFEQQLGRLKSASAAFPGGAPTLIGEFGIPYDMDHGAAYEAWAAGDRSLAPWHAQVQALNLIYNAIDKLQLHSTQWNYSAGNRNELRVGDQWNQEDLSIYSDDQVTAGFEATSGGRAVEGFCRPYVRAVQGRLVEQRFDLETHIYLLTFDADPGIGAPTEIYLPQLQFGVDFKLAIEGPALRSHRDAQAQTVQLWADKPGRVLLRVLRSTSPT